MKRFSVFLAPALVLMTLCSTVFLVGGTASAATQKPDTKGRRHIILSPTYQQAARMRKQRDPKQQDKQRQVGTVLGSGDLTYNGGPVEEVPQVFLIFWGSNWNNGSMQITSDGQVVENFFNDTGGTSYENILTQYFDTNVNIPNTLSVGGIYLDFSTPTTDTSCGGPTVQDTTIQSEVQHAITTNGWTTNSNATYFVYTPSNDFVNDGLGDCSEQVFCGYHDFSSVAHVPYAAMPYPINMLACPALATPNGNAAGDSLTNVSSHEMFEAITDPQPFSGWIDAGSQEIGDKCAWDFSAGLTHLNNGGVFALQTEYSNASSSCVNTFTATPSHIAVSPGQVDLVTTPGVSPSAQDLTLSNTGIGPLNWTSGLLPPWVSVSPTSGTLAPGASQALTLTFNTPSSTPQSYSTNLIINDPNADNSPFSVPITVASANVSKTWYFAEGYTGGNFSEFLTLANPNSAQAMVQVTYLLGSNAPIPKTYLVAPTSRYTILVNNEVGPNQNVSIVVQSDQPIIAERPMYFTYTGIAGLSIPGGSDVLGATSLAQQFDFGYLDTTPGHDTYLTILNQNSSTLIVTINYFASGGGAPIMTTHAVNPNSRGTVHVNAEGLPANTYSALVALSAPGLVERPMYLKDATTGYTGSADVVGVATPQQNWYFAEGFTASTFNERYILSNPSATATAHASVTFFLSSGAPVSVPVTLVPGAQQIISANSALTSNNINNSAQVSADQPILAERFISFKYTGQVGGSGSSVIPGASDVLGAPAPGFLFDFAEGYSGSGFGEYLTIENPNGTSALVTVTFLPANGTAPTIRFYQVAPDSRFTLFTNSVLSGQPFSMTVESNVPIVAERPMYFNFQGHQTGGSDVVGYQGAGTILPAASGLSLYAGSADGKVYGLNADLGSTRWTFSTNGGIASRAAVVNGVAYIGSLDGNLYAINTSDGSQAWSFSTNGPILSSPAVANGVVYFGSFDGFVYALNANTGNLIWSYQASNAVFSSPAVANGVVYIGSEDGFLYALTASTGTLAWKFQAQGGVGFEAEPVVASGVVYIGSEDTFEYALDASTGAKVWSYQTGGKILWDSVVSNGVVYVGSTDGFEYALDANTGAKVWSDQTGGAIDSAPVVSNGIVYFGSTDTFLYAADASTGTLIWSYRTDGSIESSPTVSNSMVFVGSSDNVIYALKASDGTLYWSSPTGGPVLSDPTIAP